MAQTENPRAEITAPLPDLVPARMLNEFAYCPRLMYLEWVQGEFAESADTLDGTYQHRRVDRPGGALPAAGAGGDGGGGEVIHSRSVHLSAPAAGLVAVIDLVESAAAPVRGRGKGGGTGEGAVTPVDYKRGRVPDTPERCWEPERVQLCAQGLILRENGYRCDAGVLYFVESRTRVPVPFDAALVARTLELLGKMRRVAAGGRIPPPLADSPKCPRCSLVGICLPDETRLLADGSFIQVTVPAGRETAREKRGRGDAAITTGGEDDAESPRVRMLIARAADGRPLYVTEPRAFVGKSGDLIQVRAPAADAARNGSKPLRGPRPRAAADDRPVLAEVRLAELSHVCLFGTAQISTQLVHELCDRQVPVAYFSTGGYFRGVTTGLPSKNIELRVRQYAAAADPAACLALAKTWVAGKIENQRTLLRRNHTKPPAMALDDLRRAIDAARKAASLETLLGVEGNAAKAYFGCFQGMLRPREFVAPPDDDDTSVPAPPDADAEAPADAEPDARTRATRESPARGECNDVAVRRGRATQVSPLPGENNDAALPPRRAGGKAATPPFAFDFNGRNRRPPTDPVNALLSLGYAVLARDLTGACWVAGLDPYLGFFHQPRYGRPALALDLMEEFRAIVVDSTVLTAINTGVVAADDFVRRGPAVALKPDARRRFLGAYERRLESPVTHPVFGYRLSYRRVLEVQARLLSRVLLGELPAYVPFTTR